MAISAGHNSIISVSADDATYNKIDASQNVSFSFNREMLDVTEFEDAARDKIAGLKDASISISGRYNGADTAQAALYTAYSGGGDIWFQVRWDGTSGHNVKCKLESLDISSDVGDMATYSASISAIAAPDTTMHAES